MNMPFFGPQTSYQTISDHMVVKNAWSGKAHITETFADMSIVSLSDTTALIFYGLLYSCKKKMSVEPARLILWQTEYEMQNKSKTVDFFLPIVRT